MDARYDFSSPATKRGAWFVLLLNAYIAVTEDAIRNCCRQLRYLQAHFPCAICKQHFGDYLKTNPPEAIVGSSTTIFEWVVGFMSAVNVRLGKMGYDSRILYDSFKNNTFSSPSPLYDFTNPYKMRDVWLVLLCNSLAVTTLDEAKLYNCQVRMLAAKHPIASQRKYILEYMRRDPVDIHILEPEGCFAWTASLYSYIAVVEGQKPYDRYLFYKQFSSRATQAPCTSCGH